MWDWIYFYYGIPVWWMEGNDQNCFSFSQESADLLQCLQKHVFHNWPFRFHDFSSVQNFISWCFLRGKIRYLWGWRWRFAPRYWHSGAEHFRDHQIFHCHSIPSVHLPSPIPPQIFSSAPIWPKITASETAMTLLVVPTFSSTSSNILISLGMIKMTVSDTYGCTNLLLHLLKLSHVENDSNDTFGCFTNLLLHLLPVLRSFSAGHRQTLSLGILLKSLLLPFVKE